jgi:hypothetical protein
MLNHQFFFICTLLDSNFQKSLMTKIVQFFIIMVQSKVAHLFTIYGLMQNFGRFIILKVTFGLKIDI